MTRKDLLNTKLPKDVVKSRVQGGASVSYVDGWTVIENANRIFGFEGWSWKLESIMEVENSEAINKKSGAIGWRIAYIAQGTVTILPEETMDANGLTVLPQTFSDIGFGNATSYQSIGDAVESATKEAATDCMKRCLRFKGNQFGLALYDKAQRNVGDSVVNQIREYVSKLDESKQEASKGAVESYVRSSKVGSIDQLTSEQTYELFDLIKQLNEGKVNEHQTNKKGQK